jgi:hypothetical protein
MMFYSKSLATISFVVLMMVMAAVTSHSSKQGRGGGVFAFSPSPSIHRPSTTTTAFHAYVPDGLTREQYEKIKMADQRKNKGKNLGALGPRGFKSRSMQAWQQAYEQGKASHAFAPIGYREALQKGQIKKSDVPYMIRPNGSWDNSDVKGGKRLKWTKADRDYAKGGYKKEQSASILGSGPGIDWTGTRPRELNLANGRVPGFS